LHAERVRSEQALGTGELVRSLIDLFQAQAREHGITLYYDLKNDPMLSGRCVSAVRDALSNLLLNALQATARGGKVSLSATLDNTELVIAVQRHWAEAFPLNCVSRSGSLVSSPHGKEGQALV
jgi:signal transduction histidine kinase